MPIFRQLWTVEVGALIRVETLVVPPRASMILDASLSMPSYPINGYKMQALYPIIFDAPIVPSWHHCDMSISPSQFDVETMRERMKAAGVTQKDLAAALGVHQSAVSNILKGTRGVKVHEAATIERALGMDATAAVVMVPAIGITCAGNWREAIELPGRTVPIPRGVAGSRAFAVQAEGDSLNQIVDEGAFLVVDPDQSQLFSDRVYLIENGEHETTVKVYRSNPARFEARSSTEGHPTIFMGETFVKVIGRVVWQGSPL